MLIHQPIIIDTWWLQEDVQREMSQDLLMTIAKHSGRMVWQSIRQDGKTLLRETEAADRPAEESQELPDPPREKRDYQPRAEKPKRLGKPDRIESILRSYGPMSVPQITGIDKTLTATAIRSIFNIHRARFFRVRRGVYGVCGLHDKIDLIESSNRQEQAFDYLTKRKMATTEDIATHLNITVEATATVMDHEWFRQVSPGRYAIARREAP